MSLSQADQGRKTAIIATETQANGTNDTKQLDATEDRKIHAIDIKIEDVGQTEVHNTNTNVWTGSNPFSGSNYVNDNEGLAVSYDFVYSGSGGRSAEPGVYMEFNEAPFDWDKHVTLSVEHFEFENDSNTEVTIHYTEA